MNPRPSHRTAVGRDRRDPRAAAAAATAAATATLALLMVGLCSSAAEASFHFAHIQRVLTGLNGTTDVQFVEIRMESANQNLVSGSKLLAFKADGTFDHVVLTVSGNVTSGAARPWIMASQAFAAAAGITPDFVFDSSGGKGLLAESGMVCWGKPADQTKPANSIDCVSYGNYTGAANAHTSTPSVVSPFGHGLVRVADTGSSAADFSCEDPALPRNNATTAGSLEASSPCTGCGNGAIENLEACDDGDAIFVAGDHCSADCVAFSCGVPTKVDNTTPVTSDALFVLKAAVQGANCDLRVCDVNGSQAISSSDALLILKSAVGQDVAFECPQ